MKLRAYQYVPMLVGLVILAVIGGILIAVNRIQENEPFDGERAYQDVVRQVEMGPRIPGSAGHRAITDHLTAELTANDWQVEHQKTTAMDHPIHNIIAKRGNGRPWYIIGAHYDTRQIADRDPLPENQDKPVPGANDGASGVAVLLELSRTLPHDFPGEVWLLFIDAEDQGSIEGWDWILGSKAAAASLQENPDAVIIVDMVGDADQQLLYERNSDPELSAEIWKIAGSLGYGDRFIPQPGHSLLDDHIPFISREIPAIDIIDFDYPFWHTVEDTEDKVSPDSLKAVGDTLMMWLKVNWQNSQDGVN